MQARLFRVSDDDHVVVAVAHHIAADGLSMGPMVKNRFVVEMADTHTLKSAVTRLRNNTSEHIDTKSITDKIRISLIKSGKVRFSALDSQADLMNQYKLQGTMADTSTQKTAGKQAGSKYLLDGDISSIVKVNGRTKDVYYKISLKATDIESGVIEWADEVEIRKDSVRRLFGS